MMAKINAMGGIHPQLASIAAGLAVAVIAIGFIAWSGAPDAKARMSALEAQAAVVKKSSHSGGDLKAFPEGTVCTGGIDDAFRNRLNLALGNSGLAINTLDIAEASPLPGGGGLNAYHVSLKASGSYEGALLALETLRRYRPKLFLDSLALRNRTQTVDLELEGQWVCR